MRIAALFTLFFLVAAPGVYARGKPNISGIFLRLPPVAPRFKQLADAVKSPLVSVVDCAQGGQTMGRWNDATQG